MERRRRLITRANLISVDGFSVIIGFRLVLSGKEILKNYKR